jgi:hypothetical protein
MTFLVTFTPCLPSCSSYLWHTIVHLTCITINPLSHINRLSVWQSLLNNITHVFLFVSFPWPSKILVDLNDLRNIKITIFPPFPRSNNPRNHRPPTLMNIFKALKWAPSCITPIETLMTDYGNLPRLTWNNYAIWKETMWWVIMGADAYKIMPK